MTQTRRFVIPLLLLGLLAVQIRPLPSGSTGGHGIPAVRGSEGARPTPDRTTHWRCATRRAGRVAWATTVSSLRPHRAASQPLVRRPPAKTVDDATLPIRRFASRAIRLISIAARCPIRTSRLSAQTPTASMLMATEWGARDEVRHRSMPHIQTEGRNPPNRRALE